MAELVKQFHDGSRIEFDMGPDQEECILVTAYFGTFAADVYFHLTDLRDMAERHGSERIYREFVEICELTGEEIDPDTLEHIAELASGYGQDSTAMAYLYTLFYAAMILDTRHVWTELGSRIKRLAVHMVLVDKLDALDVADTCREMRWWDIDRQCKARGF